MSPDKNILKQLEEVCPGRVRSAESLAPFTTWKIGGPAQWLAAPQDLEELTRLLGLLTGMGRPWHILGRGSNVLIGDRGVAGAVIYLGPSWSWIRVRKRFRRTVHLEVGAGTPLPAIVRYGLRHGLTGLEFLEYMAAIKGMDAKSARVTMPRVSRTIGRCKLKISDSAKNASRLAATS